MRAAGVTYFLHNPLTQLVKIGRSTTLRQRQRDLEHSSGTALRLLGTLPDGTLEKRHHTQFAHARRRGEWFALTPDLAAFLRDTFGCRIRAPQERTPRAPDMHESDVAHDLEALAQLGLRRPDLDDLTDYLDDAFRPDGWLWRVDEDAEAEGPEAVAKDRERCQEACDEALDPLLQRLEEWEAHWFGWMAPGQPVSGDYLDLWLAYWRPAGPLGVVALRRAMGWAAIASDHDAIEWLRLRPVLVDRQTGALEVLEPEELYSDELHGLLWFGASVAA